METGKATLFILLLSGGLFSRLSAQDTLIGLTTGEAVAQALAGNSSIRLAAIDEKAAGARFRETDAMFLPRLHFAYSAVSTNNPLNAFGFRLQQKAITAADFDPARLNHPDGLTNFTTSLDLQQPLINVDQQYRRKGAAIEREIYRLKAERTKEEIIYEVRKAYMELQLACRTQKVITDGLETAQALFRYTSDRVEQGMLGRADVLNVQVQVKTMESSLAEARSQVRNASDYLSLLMGRPAGPVYMPDSTESVNISLLHADSVLPESRADLSALKKSVEASGMMLRASKAARFPRLNAFGSYQLNDSRMFGFGASGYMAGVSLSWEIFNGNSVHNRAATLSLEKNKLTEQYSAYHGQSIIELQVARRKLDDASFRISRQQAAVTAAAESYRILRDRYEQGLSGSTDILLAQSQLSRQRLALSQAIFDRDVSMAYLSFLTSSPGK